MCFYTCLLLESETKNKMEQHNPQLPDIMVGPYDERCSASSAETTLFREKREKKRVEGRMWVTGSLWKDFQKEKPEHSAAQRNTV